MSCQVGFGLSRIGREITDGQSAHKIGKHKKGKKGKKGKQKSKNSSKKSKT
jgi:hypothetical protein